MKSGIASIIIIVSLLIAVSIIFFVAPGNISYLCNCVYAITFAFYIVTMIFSYTTLQKSLKQIFYGTPTLLVIYALLIIQTLFLLAIRVEPNISNWIVVIVESLVIVGGVILIITLLTSKSYLNEVDLQTGNKVDFIKQLSADLTIIMQEEAPETKKQLEQLLSKVRYSDPISDASLKSLEDSIAYLTESLKTSEPHLKKDIIKRIILLLEERNIKCRVLK